jgi:hypothetical protein
MKKNSALYRRSFKQEHRVHLAKSENGRTKKGCENMKKWFENLKISKKLIIGFTLITFLASLSAW